MDCCTIPSARMCYRLSGDATLPLVVVEGMLAGSCAEWWHLADEWAHEFRILLYDRAGYGSSSESSLPRSPGNIALELRGLLDGLRLTAPIILVGHSMGGLYAQQFARLYPDRVQALLLLDPVSAKNYAFRHQMSRSEYAKSGFGKSANLRTGLAVTRLGLGPLLKPLLRKGPPFYYFRDLSAAAEEYILRNLTQAKLYRAALAENHYIDPDRRLPELEEPGDFPQVPLHLVCHAPETVVAEIEKYGGADHATAVRLEALWTAVMREYMAFSSQSTYSQSLTSGHHIHLSDPDLIRKALHGLAGSRATS